MDTITCPHCNNPCITTFQKSMIGIFPMTCKSCGQKVGMPYWWRVLTMIPMFAAFIAVPRLLTDPYAIAGTAAFLTLLTYELQNFIPLIKK